MQDRPEDWDGRTCLGERFALGVWTTASTGNDITPKIVLAAAASPAIRCLIRPERLGDFLRVHRKAEIAGYDAGRLHWAIADHLGRGGDREGLDILWDYSRDMRFGDVGLLEQLVALARQGIEVRYPDLAKLANESDASQVPDEQQLQSLFNELGGGSWDALTDDLRDGVSKITEIVLNRYEELTVEALHIIEQVAGDEDFAAIGPLSLGIQVQGMIALHAAARNGLRLRKDAGEAIDQIVRRCDAEFAASSRRLGEKREASKCFTDCCAKKVTFRAA
jgi:hypothetical protein